MNHNDTPTTDQYGHRVPTSDEIEATSLNDGPMNHVRLTDDDGDFHDLPLVDECCGDREIVWDETPFGEMERCSTCGAWL